MATAAAAALAAAAVKAKVGGTKLDDLVLEGVY